MQRKTKVLLSILVCSILVMTNTVTYIFAATPSSITYLSSGSLNTPASYIIWQESGTSYSRNGKSGQIISDSNLTTLIQTSLDSLTSGRTSKEKIVLKLNDAQLDGYISVPSYTTIELQGKIKLGANSPRIYYADGETDIEIFGGKYTGYHYQNLDVQSCIRFENCYDIRIHDLTGEGFWGILAGWVINLIGCSNILIDNIKAYDNGGDGIAINACTDAVVSNLILGDNGYIDVGGTGIWISSSRVSLNNVIAYNNSLCGVRVEAWDRDTHDITLNNIVTYGNVYNGINLDKTASGAWNLYAVSLSNIETYGNGLHGIHIYAETIGNTFDIQVNNARVYNNGHVLGGYGINIENALAVDLTNIIVRNSYFEGLRFVLSAKSTVNNAKVVNNGQSELYGSGGIHLYASDQNILNNIFAYDDQGSQTQDWGIYESSTSDTNIISNCFTNTNAVGGIKILGAATRLHDCWNSTTWISEFP